jgi:hypothetical protein
MSVTENRSLRAVVTQKYTKPLTEKELKEKKLQKYFQIKALYLVTNPIELPEDAYQKVSDFFREFQQKTAEEQEVIHSQCVNEFFKIVKIFKKEPSEIHKFVSYFSFHWFPDEQLSNVLLDYRVKPTGQIMDTGNYIERKSNTAVPVT